MLRPAMFLGKLDDRSSPPESEDLATTRLPLAKTPPSHWSVPRRGAAIMLLDEVGIPKLHPSPVLAHRQLLLGSAPPVIRKARAFRKRFDRLCSIASPKDCPAK
jgi:hypothetical protein